MGVKGNHLTQVRKKVVGKFVEMCHVHSPRCTDQDVPVWIMYSVTSLTLVSPSMLRVITSPWANIGNTNVPVMLSTVFLSSAACTEPLDYL